MSDQDERFRLLFELGCAFAARVELGDLSALVVSKCREVFHARAASILLLDPERHELYFPYVAEENPELAARLRSLRFPADRGIAGAVLQSGRSLRIDDVHADKRFLADIDRTTGLTTRDLLCAPLRSHQGAIGVIQVLNRGGGLTFTDADLTFLEALAGSVAVALENARFYAQLKQQIAALEQAVLEHNQLVAIRHELDIARHIQQSILPRTFPPFPERQDFEIFATMLPAREVGGDFYDFFLIDGERLGFVIGDVSDKGVPAALFMAISRTVLKSIALDGALPGECLERVNHLLCSDNRAEMFVTVCYGILNTRTGEIDYSNGGHDPPYLLRQDGSVERLASTGGTVLGMLEETCYSGRHVVLQPGDAIFLYTDGVTEAMDVAGNLFSEARLRAVLERCGAAPPEGIIRAVIDETSQHSNGAPQNDDITTLAIRMSHRRSS
jgi:serine phosphatase RsbU (regulator of sigma subunit)